MLIIKTPFIHCVADDCEFSNFKDMLIELTKDETLDYKEVNPDINNEGPAEWLFYKAVFFLPGEEKERDVLMEKAREMVKKNE